MASREETGAVKEVSGVSYRLAASALVRMYMESGSTNDRDDEEIAS